jgi:hypothetical protein
MLEERAESFLPANDDLLGNYQPDKNEKIIPLSKNDEEVLSRLNKTEKQREADVLVYGAAEDDIYTLSLPESELKVVLVENITKNSSLENKLKGINHNISKALLREMEIVNLNLMDLSKKEGIKAKINKILVKIKAQEVKVDQDINSAIGILRKIYDKNTIIYLSEIFSKRFKQLNEDQIQHALLSKSKLANTN